MTTSVATTLQKALDRANLSNLDACLAKAKLGTMLTPLKRTFTGLTAAAAFDLTAIDGTGETAGAGNEKRLAALSVTTLRVTAVGTGALGTRIMTDTGGTALAGDATSPGVAKLSDDGKTITFEGTVTAFVITYIPRSFTDMTAADKALDGSP